MKSVLKVSLLAMAVAGVSACNQEAKTQAPAPQAEVKLETPAQKESYALGMVMGQQMALSELKEMGIEIDQALVMKGFEETLNGSAKLTEEELETVMREFSTKVTEIQTQKAEAIAAEAKQEGVDYLEQNKAKEGVTVTESGLQYEVITAAEGDKPSAEDTVEVHYRGTLIDGTEFDSSYSRNQTAKFPLNRVIPGWTEGVQLMPVGSKYRFVIPSELAYGERDTGTIPAHSTLVFEVELIAIEKAEEAAQ
ncbi:FKBP-type peptidyl-prolyl cis-trans isomerase [Paraferrimonas sedimenticola]|uniref:Peptidyl-prolyl cis-trans isomerase n=1 Tax=Paraferrimonas sedimenticola TaxID=375674 RepID=A0AA37RVU1_9GAMM|nr:FKBP-type peptidyl-prolyl cis-trans isomerase [Paraferrimonas sedimenticola]GLP95774.1 peptidyl-prolyl cis-trans isomerase [Paraferrimonas sedimenticola]